MLSPVILVPHPQRLLTGAVYALVALGLTLIYACCTSSTRARRMLTAAMFAFFRA